MNRWPRELQDRLRSARDLETWEGHLDTRLPELKQLEAFMPESGGTLLELGCGNALGAAYFSQAFQKVIATDLPGVDHEKHAIGLEKAKALVKAAGAGNVELEACSAEQLPFADSSIDVILAMYCLEHIPDKNKCLDECLRVLKPGGRMVFTLPGAAWSLVYPLAFYHELFLRVWKRFGGRLFPIHSNGSTVNTTKSLSTPESSPVVHDWASFRKAYPHFPLPQPHGAYSSYFQELFAHRRGAWLRLFRSRGFPAAHAHALNVIPAGLLRIFFGVKLGDHIFGKLQWLDRALVAAGGRGAQFYCVTAEKPKSPGAGDPPTT